MTASADIAALLDACAARPEEDTPRLCLADALEEAGDRDRAEFVRVQVELATLDPPVEVEAYALGADRRTAFVRDGDAHKVRVGAFVRFSNGKSSAEGIVTSLNTRANTPAPWYVQFRPQLYWSWGRVGVLRRRERELLAAHPHWRPVCPCVLYRNGVRGIDAGCAACGGSTGDGHTGKLERGLLREVKVPRLDDVLEPLDRQGSLRIDEDGERWVATRWARDLLRDPWFRAVERVRAQDREPYPIQESVAGSDEWPPPYVNIWAWFNQAHSPANYNGANDLPVLVYDALPIDPSQGFVRGGGLAKHYATPDAARDALAAALAAALKAAGSTGAG